MALLLYRCTCEVTMSLCLQVTVECLDEGRLVLYPQILLACFALLGTSYVHLWGLLLDLLATGDRAGVDEAIAAAEQAIWGEILNPRLDPGWVKGINV